MLAEEEALNRLKIQRGIAVWFSENARDLPWREDDCSAWGVLVSEIMLQQTPVVRVLPIWRQWLADWPTPADFAAASPAEVLRAWGKLGYPRRALRLHAAAAEIVANHGGVVPDNYQDLLALPGIGSYTAAAVAAFAYGRRTTVVDTNIRRVFARLIVGQALPAPALTAAEMKLAAQLLPEDTAESVTWNAATMELGALVCTARSPRCDDCPVIDSCAWIKAGQPEPTYKPKGQAWAGTDRQVRGAVMAVLRAAHTPIHADLLWNNKPLEDAELSQAVAKPLAKLHALNTHAPQLERSLAGLLADGLAVKDDAGYSLPA